MKIKNATLINFGSLTPCNEDKDNVTDSIVGYFMHADKIEFTEGSDNFNGRIGLSFGIEYYLESINPVDRGHNDVHFISRITHPLIVNPETKVSACETVEKKHNYLNEKNFDYYTFEYPWEIKPGIWNFQVIEDNNILLEKSFTII